MRIVQIDDDYIEKLREYFPSVMDEKRFTRSHKRKYVGVVFVIDGFNYYAPFSSPKNRDYNPDGTIKKNTMLSLKMVNNERDGQQLLLGSIRLLKMIPVPMKYVYGYSVENEPDKKYQSIVMDESKWISEHQNLIIKKARQLYNFKKNEHKLKNQTNTKVYDAILPFIDIEKFLFETKEI